MMTLVLNDDGYDVFFFISPSLFFNSIPIRIQRPHINNNINISNIKE